MGPKVVAPTFLTTTDAAAVLQAYAEGVMRGLGLLPTPEASVTPKQIRLMASLIGKPAHRPRAQGDGMLLRPLDVAVFATYWTMFVGCRLTGGAESEPPTMMQVMVGIARHERQIRKGLRDPQEQLVVQSRGGVVSVVQKHRADPSAIRVELDEVRAGIDRVLAHVVPQRDWIWANWRKTPVEELTAAR